MTTIKARRRHMFAEDPDLTDPLTGTQWCLCGRPATNQIHDLPDAPEQAEHRRWAGESDNE